MSGVKDVFKGGWHPKGKDGGKESWRGDFKGLDQVAGWMGKGKKNSSDDAAHSHQSAPLSSLKDPASFGAPPKRGAAGLPSSTSISTASGDESLGAAINPTTRAEDAARQSRYNTRQKEEQDTQDMPARPYRVDTTGISTAGLPLPPRRRDGDSPVASTTQATGRAPPPLTPNVATAGPPRLPPRLPPRQDPRLAPIPPTQQHSTVDQPTASDGNLNQGALGRLGRAGVSVPGFGIGGKSVVTSPPLPSRSGSSTPNWNDIPEDMLSAPRSRATSRSPRTASPVTAGPGGQLSELQSRFSKLKAGSSNDQTNANDEPSSSGGTTWAQKQAALNTAQSFRQDPKSVSMADARDAASTAKNFHDRHGDQVASGLKAAQGLQQRLGIGLGSPSTAHAGSLHKAPPPPPPKKPELENIAASSAAPPPVPLSSKPR